MFDDAVARHPKDPVLRVNMAYAYLGLKDADAAEKQLTEALKLADTADVRIGLATVAIEKKQLAEAKTHLDKAMEQAAGQVQLQAMAAELYRQAHAPNECIQAYDKAISAKPLAQFYANRAVCKQMNKDNAGAKQDYQKAIEVDGAYGPARYLYGRYLLSVEKNKKAAIEQFEQCAKVAPQSNCQQAADKAKSGK